MEIWTVISTRLIASLFGSLLEPNLGGVLVPALLLGQGQKNDTGSLGVITVE
jgi:hypothetical protein